jgi:hypothetical protein
MPNKVMFSQDEKEMLLPFDSFTQMLYVLGIKFGCDWWGICRNDTLELTSHINPDAQIDQDRIQKSLDDLHTTGLIEYIGQNNSLIVVKDFGMVNEFGFLKTNHSKKANGSESKWLIHIKVAIKSGELPPYFLEIPSILMAKKKEFIERYENGTLQMMTYFDKSKKIERNYYDSLMYKDLYHWYHESKKKGESNEHPF